VANTEAMCRDTAEKDVAAGRWGVGAGRSADRSLLVDDGGCRPGGDGICRAGNDTLDGGAGEGAGEDEIVITSWSNLRLCVGGCIALGEEDDAVTADGIVVGRDGTPA
jgi:hypothetical protein